MNHQRLLLLSADDLATLLAPPACLGPVERAFRLLGEGRAAPPVWCGQAATRGVFHLKAATLDDDDATRWFAAKVNANFPSNPAEHGLPTIQGALLLFDATLGTLRALLDSGELTAARTAAATAVAARWLAPRGATTLTLIGCGRLGRAHLPALCHALPTLERVFLVDREEGALAAATHTARGLGLGAEVAADLVAACRGADVIVTATPSTSPLVDATAVRPGALVAGVGADNPQKHELAPDLLAGARVVTDLRAQAAHLGDLAHALAAGSVATETVAVELGEVIAGRHPGRRSEDETVVFDSTGIALQDVAAAAFAYREAARRGLGQWVPW
jgi:alanine dehydrogenase